MKKIQHSSIHVFLFLVLISIGFSSCSKKKDPMSYRKLKENNFNFKAKKSIDFYGLSMHIPVEFERDFKNDSYLKETNAARVYSIPEIGVFITLEYISVDQAETIYYDFLDEEELEENESSEIEHIDVVHDHYFYDQMVKLNFRDYSIKEILEHPSHTAVFNLGIGRKKINDNLQHHAVFTIEKNGSFYHVQCITTPELSSYLQDDFIRMIISAR